MLVFVLKVLNLIISVLDCPGLAGCTGRMRDRVRDSRGSRSSDGRSLSPSVSSGSSGMDYMDNDLASRRDCWNNEPEEESKSHGVPQMRTPHMSRKYAEREVLERKLGLTAEEKKRARALNKMGVDEDDVKKAERILVEAAPHCRLSRKEERILGYSVEKMKRARALERLGVTEEEIETAAARSLGALGVPRPQQKLQIEAYMLNMRCLIESSNEALMSLAAGDRGAVPQLGEASQLFLTNLRRYIVDPKRRVRTYSAPPEDFGDYYKDEVNVAYAPVMTTHG